MINDLYRAINGRPFALTLIYGSIVAEVILLAMRF